jgi:hypothetical protein
MCRVGGNYKHPRNSERVTDVGCCAHSLNLPPKRAEAALITKVAKLRDKLARARLCA